MIYCVSKGFTKFHLSSRFRISSCWYMTFISKSRLSYIHSVSLYLRHSRDFSCQSALVYRASSISCMTLFMLKFDLRDGFGELIARSQTMNFLRDFENSEAIMCRRTVCEDLIEERYEIMFFSADTVCVCISLMSCECCEDKFDFKSTLWNIMRLMSSSSSSQFSLTSFSIAIFESMSSKTFSLLFVWISCLVIFS